MAALKKVDLRELMKKQKEESKLARTKVDSPLAKYNSLGQLVCKVCNTQVKSEILWAAHLQGRKHKENVEALKEDKQPAPSAKPLNKHPLPTQSHQVSSSTSSTAPPAPAPKSILKRKSDSYTVPVKTSAIPAKKSKDSDSQQTSSSTTPASSNADLPSDFFDFTTKKAGKAPTSTTSATKGGKRKKKISKSKAVASGLPSDVFDASAEAKAEVVKSSQEAGGQEDEKKSKTAEALPEGFFDDPVMDAKVRKVEVKNTMEEEWSKFQKEMGQQQQVSETIAEEDDTVAQATRNIDEIDEQIQRYATVEKLRDKQDEWKIKADENPKSRDGDGSLNSEDEAEFEEFLDWRSKGAWK